MAALQSLPKGAKAQRVGRARSPLRAGLVMQTRPPDCNPSVRALTSAATLTRSAAAVCDRRVQLPRTLPDCLAAPMLGENRRRSQNAATKAVVPARAALRRSKFRV